MERLNNLVFAWALCIAPSLSLYASNALLNTTGIELCANTFFNCTAMNNSGVFNCTTPFESCLSQHAYLPGNKPLDCFLAESAWDNLYISCAFSGGIFIFSNILWPAILKGTAKCITKMGKSDPTEHPYVSGVGKFLMFFTDANGDGEVTATELITPQTIFTFASALLPITPWINANDQQARCNYAMTLPPH